jgi:hypothetical protein
MNSAGTFNWQRFARLLTIEIINYWKKVALASGMVFAILLFFYFDISDEPPGVFSDGIYIPLTFLGGAIFTSVIFNDMHHPLERFQYMTLPCSQLERFASKYCLTCPLFLLYAIALAIVFKTIAPVFYTIFNSGAGAIFEPTDDFPLLYILFGYMTGHILFMTGAILFRGYAVVKTGFCLFIIPYTFYFIGLISLKIFYADHFDSFLSLNPAQEVLPGLPALLLRNDIFLLSAWCAIYLWFGYLAYNSLKDHEA